MKKQLLASAVLLASVTALASHFGTYGENEIRFANAILKCPKEIAALASQPYTKITKADFIGGMTPVGVVTDYRVTFTQTLPMPSGQSTRTQVIVTELIKQTKNPAADAPSHIIEIGCKVKTLAPGEQVNSRF